MAGELLHPEHLQRASGGSAGVEEPDPSRRSTAPKGYTMDELMELGRDVRRGHEALYHRHDPRACARRRRTGKSILFEAQLGALRDLDYGIYPYTTSSNSIARVCPRRLRPADGEDRRGGRRGEGVFLLRRRGAVRVRVVRRGGRDSCEMRAMSTAPRPGRPRRVGPIDLVRHALRRADAGRDATSP